MSMRLKKGDTVRVIAGKDKGKEGKILSVDVLKNRVLVEGINMVTKSVKPNAANMNGGIINKEAPIHASNVMYLKDGQVTRIGYKFEDGKKVRVAKKDGTVID